ncbi:uncharacterized protein BDR25DRAFT_215049 [Lindgomyces ingoldianus]|uniref:Uncharacterized protein n=1 Tax=Lindgomyces ingoldianus TaxID=673940 RepID=A0ACB6R7J7_9PLEO|nr:uncharacterized protein BDR25DRAFT_215049 [Lindgomyces ingoldianus]KAF2474773.1 hypothetical protein BDR25DRAFT_215049 [Lindgomyces ingoldianus]
MKYLFGNGSNGYKAQLEKEDFVKRAYAKLDNLIKQTLEEITTYEAAQRKVNVRNRIIVSNIAADAGVEEVYQLFSEYHIRQVSILPEREPIKRTRVAEVELFDEESAKRASRIIGYIFGLLVEARRATDT